MAAAVDPVAGRGTPDQTSTKKGNSGGGGAGGDRRCEIKNSNSGRSSTNHSDGGGSGDGGDRSGRTRPSSEAVGEGSGVGAERVVGQGGDPDHHQHQNGGDASVFPRMLARNAPDFSFARSRFDADPSESNKIKQKKQISDRIKERKHRSPRETSQQCCALRL